MHNNLATCNLQLSIIVIPVKTGIWLFGALYSPIPAFAGMTSKVRQGMPTGNLKDIAQLCPKNIRILGVDLGSKTIGLALSDAGQSLATPLETINRTKFKADMEALGRIVQDYEVGGFIFGWPVNMDGSEGPACERVRSFVDEMKNHRQALGIEQEDDLWIAFWDERLSTSAVDNFVDSRVDLGKKAKRGAKGSGLTDKLAAQLILQGALDYIKNRHND